MPNTITTYYTFAAATKARASQVNLNFSNYRGTLLPIHESSQTATDLTHDLGSTDHRWNNTYVGAIDLKSSTTTAGLILKGDVANTTGSFLFQIGGVTIQEIKASGGYITSTHLAAATRQLISVTLTGNTTWSIPAGVVRAWAHVYSGGGGGGAGGGSGIASTRYAGGAGGNGNSEVLCLLDISASTVLSIACGLGGSGAAAGGSDGATGNSGASTFIYGTGFSLCVYGAAGGFGGAGATTTPGGVAGTESYSPLCIGIAGGAGGKANTITSLVTDGNRNSKWLGGAKGTGGASLSGPGGGGGAGYNGPGGAGADGVNNTNGNAGNSAPSYGSGGGGGAGGGGNSVNGGHGGDGAPGCVIIYYLY